MKITISTTLLILVIYLSLLHACQVNLSGKQGSTYLDLNLIKTCASKGLTSFRMNELKASDQHLDSSFVAKLLTPIPVNGDSTWKLQAKTWEKVYCYQWE
ncbi:MAG: hypothetical protein AAF804_01695, partial [Bacteroidota bacterium]